EPVLLCLDGPHRATVNRRVGLSDYSNLVTCHPELYGVDHGTVEPSPAAGLASRHGASLASRAGRQGPGPAGARSIAGTRLGSLDRRGEVPPGQPPMLHAQR